MWNLVAKVVVSVKNLMQKHKNFVLLKHCVKSAYVQDSLSNNLPTLLVQKRHIYHVLRLEDKISI